MKRPLFLIGIFMILCLFAACEGGNLSSDSISNALITDACVVDGNPEIVEITHEGDGWLKVIYVRRDGMTMVVRSDSGGLRVSRLNLVQGVCAQ